jgi:DNA-binding response OmpR family regulator
VDDEEIIASTTAIILCHSGFDAIFFTLPLEALRAACGDPPDLLITDVVMPRLSGIELALLMRACCPDCKVLLFSGQATTGNLIEATDGTGKKFELLAKPVPPAALLSRVQSLMGNDPAPLCADCD